MNDCRPPTARELLEELKRIEADPARSHLLDLPVHLDSGEWSGRIIVRVGGHSIMLEGG